MVKSVLQTALLQQCFAQAQARIVVLVIDFEDLAIKLLGACEIARAQSFLRLMTRFLDVTKDRNRERQRENNQRENANRKTRHRFRETKIIVGRHLHHSSTTDVQLLQTPARPH